MTEYIKIILDIIILCGLAGFIFYAVKLSRALNSFRAHRAEFDQVMINLTQHIDNAQIAVNELKQTSKESGDDLHKLVRDAQFLADELQLINEAGNSLASRLEGLAERGRKSLEVDEDSLGENVRPIRRRRSGEAKSEAIPKGIMPESDDSFAIHDPDFEEQNDDILDDDPELAKLSSAAEKELYKALKSKKK